MAALLEKRPTISLYQFSQAFLVAIILEEQTVELFVLTLTPPTPKVASIATAHVIPITGKSFVFILIFSKANLKRPVICF